MDTLTRPLEGRTAVVTGASRGIGRGIAVALAEDGADIVVNYRRDEAAAADAIAEIEALGARAIAVKASMADLEEVDMLARRAVEAFGKVDIIVNNAGVASRGNSVADTDSEEFQRLMVIHAFSAARLARDLLPQMRGRERAHIVVISSSEIGQMRAGGAPYNMAKAALEALAGTLAKEEIENGIRVHVVAPGLVATDMGTRLVNAKLGIDVADLDASQPLKRVCRPSDIAQVVRFLVSEAADFVTGQRIVIDGGADASPTGRPPSGH